MNFLILGDGAEERSWAKWIAGHAEHRVLALHPGPADDELSGVAVIGDLDEALATAGLDAVVVGGEHPFRGEALRRAAAEGLTIICLHPPGPDSEAYYQVSLSRSETGAVVVPDLPLRLHPGVLRLREALDRGELGDFRGVRHELSLEPGTGDLVRVAFARMVDVDRALLGEIEALTASGDPPGEQPSLELVVQLRAAEGRRAEVRVSTGRPEPARLTVNGSNGSLTLEYDPAFRHPARVYLRTTEELEGVKGLESWNPHEAILEVLAASRGKHGESLLPSPNLTDGTRAMELAEAAARSLRRGRTIDLHYEAISEEASFKSVMTSAGCLIFLAILAILPLALAGPALGINGTIYLAYLIPPVLVVFGVLQILRFGIRKEGRIARDTPPEP